MSVFTTDNIHMEAYVRVFTHVFEFNISPEIEREYNRLLHKHEEIDVDHFIDFGVTMHPRDGDFLNQLCDAYPEIIKLANGRKIWAQPDEEGFFVSLWFGELDEILNKLPHMPFVKLGQ